MRIRQVKPAFWAEVKIASLPHDARLFYIGLWMLADDDGWLRWNIAEIGKELYGFEGRAAREKRIERMTEAIVKALPGKLAVHDCGHAELPKLAVHQHLAGTTRRVTAVHHEHSRDCPQIPATPRDSPPRVGVSDGVGEGNGQVGKGEGVGFRAQGATEHDGSKNLTRVEEIRGLRETAANLALPPAVREAAALEADRLAALH